MKRGAGGILKDGKSGVGGKSLEYQLGEGSWAQDTWSSGSLQGWVKLLVRS